MARAVADRAERRRAGRVRAAVVFVLGVALLTAAGVVVFNDGPAARAALNTATDSPAWMVLALVGLTLVNLASVAGAFWVMTARYGRVGYFEMLALITSGWLLNNLPLRPGLAGRVAYHKAVNGIAIGDSVKVLASVLACAGVAVAMLLGALWVSRGSGGWAAAGAIAAPALILAGVTLALRARRPNGAWRWGACAGLRYVDILAWAGRYALVFAIIGKPIDAWTSATVAAASEAAMLSPVQIGLREWVVGLTSAWAGGREALTSGLIADGLNRGLEIALGLPLGIAAMLWVMKRVKRAGEGGSASRAAASRGAPADNGASEPSGTRGVPGSGGT